MMTEVITFKSINVILNLYFSAREVLQVFLNDMLTRKYSV